MKDINLFDYPKYLQNIFDKLNNYNIKAIIVGGYIRDFYLDIDSKDIDVELYGVSSIKELESILKEFGSLNSVGKSFGVFKLSLQTIEIDFSLPRIDNKVSDGHKGFEVTVDNTLDFKTASSRRDFSINSIGYDTINKIILDPFDGRKDIKNKILRAVDENKFEEDPLRVFRAVGFASRFHFTLEKNLFSICKKMASTNVLSELPKERIYEEIKKILLKSSHPSKAFYLLKEIKALKYLSPLEKLSQENFLDVMYALDKFQSHKSQENKKNLFLMFCILCQKFNDKNIDIFISHLTNEIKMTKKIKNIVFTPLENYYTDSQILFLATKVNIEDYLFFMNAVNDKNENLFKKIKNKAIKLNVFNKKEENFLKGKDILDKGISPSKEYSKILLKAYQAQLNLEIRSHKEAIQWLENYLLT